MGPKGCPETSVRSYRYSLRNNLEERWSHDSSVLECYPVSTGNYGGLPLDI
jgi:hypothetical protein